MRFEQRPAEKAVIRAEENAKSTSEFIADQSKYVEAFVSNDANAVKIAGYARGVDVKKFSSKEIQKEKLQIAENFARHNRGIIPKDVPDDYHQYFAYALLEELAKPEYLLQ